MERGPIRQNKAAYDSAWARLVNYLGDDRASVVEYLMTNVLPDRKFFMTAWVGHTPHLGNHTTARGESAHSWLKSHMHSHKAGMANSFENIADAVTHQLTTNTVHLENGRISSLSGIKLPFKSLHGKISIHALHLVQEQYQLWKKNSKAQSGGADTTKCTGSLWATMGIPCWHMLDEIFAKEDEVTPSHFHLQWNLQYHPDKPDEEDYDFDADFNTLKEELPANHCGVQTHTSPEPGKIQIFLASQDFSSRSSRFHLKIIKLLKTQDFSFHFEINFIPPILTHSSPFHLSLFPFASHFLCMGFSLCWFIASTAVHARSDGLERLQLVGMAIPTAWSFSSSSGSYSDELEQLQLVGIASRRAGEAPGRRDSFPTNWSLSSSSGSYSDKLELLQLVGKQFRRAGEAPGRRIASRRAGEAVCRSYPDGLGPLQLVGIASRTAGEAPVCRKLSRRPGASPARREAIRQAGAAPVRRELFRQAGAAPVRRNSFPTSWRGSSLSRSYPDGLGPLQLVRIASR
ncbi:hypothetical protein PSTT_11451 [Puccinia striiformis]|uniref:Uncharacterized protein n=1 Tax=Puccinia striiformis TaxID=27350 RepID=A0A2S4V073_9BASI|nr:hypothetical protein PSTT_11451 [Puccinia striiformis]